LPGVESLLAVARHPERRLARAARHDLGEIRTRVVEGYTVFRGDPLRKAVVDQLAVARPPPLFAVVMRARAPRQEAEAVHPLELRAERIGHARLEPADHPGTRTPEDAAVLPRLSEQRVDAVHAPDREHVRGVATADADAVLCEHHLAQVLGRPGEGAEVGELGPLAEAIVEPREAGRVLGDRGRDVHQVRPVLADEAEDVVVEQLRLLDRVSAAAKTDDVPLHRHVPEFYKRRARYAGYMKIGYWLSSEEHDPRELVQNAVLAEEAGFDHLLVSDHIHPWVDAQGHSPFVWGVIGAIAQATERIQLGTAVTCPLIRVHPAIVAHAAATAQALMEGRFFLGVGTGENLNEHVLGDRWPRADERLEMLEEAVEIIRKL